MSAASSGEGVFTGSQWLCLLPMITNINGSDFGPDLSHEGVCLQIVHLAGFSAGAHVG